MMIRIGLLVVLITTGFCSTIWTRTNTTCFQADKTPVTQHKATKLCKERGAVLHSIKDSQELEALKLIIDPGYYWVSAVRINNSNTEFQWSDGRSCPSGWWCDHEPGTTEGCTLFCVGGNSCLLDYPCDYQSFGFLCSKPYVKVWTLVNSTEYNSANLCGVGIMPNCDGLSCEDLCQFDSSCDKFAKMHNLCINLKNISQTENCIIDLRSNFQVYSSEWSC